MLPKSMLQVVGSVEIETSSQKLHEWRKETISSIGLDEVVGRIEGHRLPQRKNRSNSRCPDRLNIESRHILDLKVGSLAQVVWMNLYPSSMVDWYVTNRRPRLVSSAVSGHSLPFGIPQRTMRAVPFPSPFMPQI